METPLSELCKGIPSEFQEFMEYCRVLKFEQDPDYKRCIDFFSGCMSRKNMDPKIFDYTWKQNRLQKDRDNLKAQMMQVLNKKAVPVKKDVTVT